MRTAPLLLLATVCTVALSYQSNAQDSTNASTLSLGRVSLKKEFTQSITIKGTDLERMPFASLSDALQAWSFGYQADNANIVYAIDGVVINDVNVYSKYDIEEVVLVQNAVGTLNGAVTTQILALVKTRRRGPGSSGFSAAGQSYLVKADPKQLDLPSTIQSTKNYFHNYYVGGYYNTQSVQLHVSANYLRDVSPSNLINNLQVIKPRNTDRFGINASLQARLGRAHELTFRINATPQISEYEESVQRTSAGLGYYDDYRDKATTINPSVVLRSALIKGLTNELTASFATGKGTADIDRENTNLQGEITFNKAHTVTKAQQWVVMDNLTYHAPLNNDWSLDPSVNLFYRHVKYDLESVTSYQRPGGGLGGGGISYTSNTRNEKGGIFLVTPSLNLYYRKIFNFQAGVQTNLSTTNGADINKVLPFATTSIDVVKLFKPLGATSLQLFGSIGQSDNVGDSRLNLNTTSYVPSFGFISYLPTLFPFQPKKSLWNWQTGTRLGLLDGRLSMNYVYDSRSYNGAFVTPTPGIPTITYVELQTRSHHINLQWQVLNNQAFTWRTNLNTTSRKNKIKNLASGNPGTPSPVSSFGNRTNWTGGWANRFAFKGLTAGVDVLYNFGSEVNTFTLAVQHIDAISLANVYVGYAFQLKGNRTVECYANSRNPVQDKNLQNTESYKYYGLGFKATL